LIESYERALGGDKAAYLKKLSGTSEEVGIF